LLELGHAVCWFEAVAAVIFAEVGAKTALAIVYMQHL
jgi:putative Ca2+/H+ antiporter (TMEM165/GDT1 family)